MEVKEKKTCDTCTHRGSCDKAELGKPACVSYQVGYKKVVVIKSHWNVVKTIGKAFEEDLIECIKRGVVCVQNCDIFNIEVPETFHCNDIIIETKQENK